MIQITSTGNNFGADPITFRAHYENGLLMLNGSVSIDTQTPEFIAAETLEIYVPTLQVRKSVNTAVYMAHSPGSNQGLTILKTWIKDPNTICIEKDRNLTRFSEWKLFFCNAYAPKGKDCTIQGYPKCTMSLSGFGSDGKIKGQACFETEHWTCIALELNGLNDVVPNQQFEFGISGLTALEEFDFPMFAIDTSRSHYGNYFGWCHYSHGTVTCDGIKGYTTAGYRTTIIYGIFIH